MGLFKRTYANASDEELMLGVSKGDDSAFAKLYDRYSHRLANYFAARLGPDKMLVEDAVHDLFMKIIEKPHLFDSTRRFSSWVFTVAMNMCKNEYRRRYVRKVESPLTELQNQLSNDVDVEGRLDSKLFSTEINLQLSKMDASKKDTFIFRFQQQMTLEEISDIVDCSIGTVKSRLFYTLRTLAEQLQEFNPNMRS